jgi:aminoglycoside phosphotransferase (APT) family kinase protein
VVTARRQLYGSAIRDAPPPPVLSERLCRWLSDRFGCEVTDADQPARISGGFDFWIYSLHVTGTALPVDWSAPIVARVPPRAERFALLERESLLQAWAADHGYPAPRVVDVLAPGELFESPVQIVQRVPGGTMTDAMTARPWRIPRLVGRLGELHARVHALPVPDWARSAEWSVVERRLALVQFVLERHSHPELAVALEQVERLRPSLDVAEPVLCHGDFHPMNLLVDGDDTAVIDWTDAGIGDAHSDIARTAWLFLFASAASPRRAERSVLKPMAPVLSRRYLASYRRHRPVDPDRVRLWMPLHLLHAWAMAVADEAELIGPSRAGQDIRSGLSAWAGQQFSVSMRMLPRQTSP